MNLLSKIRDFINEILDSFDRLWSFLFSTDKPPEKSKEFEASIISDDRQDERFISKANSRNVEEYSSEDDPFEIISNDTNI